MELTGTIFKLMPEQSGEGRNGTWRKREVIVETPGQYPKKVCITVWGDKIDQVALKEGDEVTAHIDIESREYNNRWYTDVKAWKIDRKEGMAATSDQGAPPPGVQDMPMDPANTTTGMEGDDDLPF